MIKYFILLFAFTPVAVSAKEDTKQLENSMVTKLVASYEFASEPGLYEIISMKTGNIVYLYIDRSGNVVITSHEKAE